MVAARRRIPLRYKMLSILLAFLAAGILVNVLAYKHAHAFTHYSRSAEAIQKPESLSWGAKIRLGINGIAIPRPENTSDPGSIGLPFATRAIPVNDSESLEAWFIDHSQAKGTAILGHGYMTCKCTLLQEAKALHELGFAVLMIDFRGHGGSPRSDTTLGIREGEDVAAACRYAQKTWPERPLLVYGFSMGSAAALRAIAHHDIQPRALVLDAPFDRMIHVVRVRFQALKFPSWPGAELVLFWGGRQLGFDGFAHNPEEDAKAVRCPTLVLHGDKDVRATPDMVTAVYDRLGGPKRREMYTDVGHEPTVVVDPVRWKSAVRAIWESPEK